MIVFRKQNLCFHKKIVFVIDIYALLANDVLFITCIYIYIYRYAVVTGANKGIGYGICKKLALNGVVVVLTARNEKRGLDAVERLKEFGLSDLLVFHQLDVTDPPSVASLTQFIKTRFGRLDILVYYLHVTIYFPPSFFNLF